MTKKRHSVLFAFLNYKSSQTIKRVEIFRSFIFQLLQKNEALRPVVQAEYNANYRSLSSSPDFVKNLLRNLLECIGVTYIVVDGLDEISRGERQLLLNALLELCSSCSKVRLLISSRKDFDITKLLSHKAQPLTVDLQNTVDIEAYVECRVEEWLETTNIDRSSSVANEIKKMVRPIAAKSEGNNMSSSKFSHADAFQECFVC